MPAALFAAQQRVRLAGFAADLEGVYRLPSGKPATKAQIQRARRQRVKPGELIVSYPKAGRSLRVQLYGKDGRMDRRAYMALSRLLYSPKESHLGEDPWVAYHPRVFAMLYFVGQHFDRPVEVVSAFRVQRQGSRRTSNHNLGRAVDIVVRAVPRRRLLRYMDGSFRKAGVGWYPRSTFLHLDTRKANYYWTDFSGPGQRQRNRERRPPRKARPGTDPTEHTVHLRPRDLYKVK
jgi:uncharacterized protein YcbK (DUF882 family)